MLHQGNIYQANQLKDTIMGYAQGILHLVYQMRPTWYRPTPIIHGDSLYLYESSGDVSQEWFMEFSISSMIIDTR